MSGRWKTISPSQFPWEQDGLDFIQRALPNREPFRAYSNFEFIADDGSINEVDLLIISRYSLFLVEIKSRPGEVGGDSHTWIWRDGAREYFDDNPLLLTNRKAKKLASLLRKQLTLQKRRTPYIQSLVFLSDPAQRCKLAGPARENVHLRADIANKLFDETALVASAQRGTSLVRTAGFDLLRLVSASGSELLRIPLQGADMYTLDASSFPAGNYILVLSRADGSSVRQTVQVVR